MSSATQNHSSVKAHPRAASLWALLAAALVVLAGCAETVVEPAGKFDAGDHVTFIEQDVPSANGLRRSRGSFRWR